jgi:hypothetical protein
MNKTGAIRIFGYAVTCNVIACSSYFENYMKGRSGKTAVRWQKHILKLQNGELWSIYWMEEKVTK